MRGMINCCRSVADLLFPRKCVICSRELLLFEKHFCLDCLTEIPLTYFWRCSKKRLPPPFIGNRQIDGVYSLFYYSGKYKKVLHSLKYRSNVAIARYLGRILGAKMAECKIDVDYIISVPLHFVKQWKRGYNQAYIIAKEMSGALKDSTVATHIVVKRVRFTKTQTKKQKQERLSNVCRAFRLYHSTPRHIKRYSRLFRGKCILLVDDVLTTGATLDACCSLLRQFDCKIIIATLAWME